MPPLSSPSSHGAALLLPFLLKISVAAADGSDKDDEVATVEVGLCGAASVEAGAVIAREDGAGEVWGRRSGGCDELPEQGGGGVQECGALRASCGCGCGAATETRWL